MLFIGGSDGCAIGVFQREFHGVMERDWLREQGSGQEQENRQ
jgi:hypothetical protein